MDFSNESAAKKTLLQSAVRRFLTLRAEVGRAGAACSQSAAVHCRRLSARAVQPARWDSARLAGQPGAFPWPLMSKPNPPDQPTPTHPTLVQYPEEERPSYEKKSSHLRGRDAWLVDRVTREFLAAYAQVGLVPVGVPASQLVGCCPRMCRREVWSAASAACLRL